LKKRSIIPLFVLFLIAIWWFISAPPADLQIGPSYSLGPVSQTILHVENQTDFLAQYVRSIDCDIQGYDDIVFDHNHGIAYASSMDGWIWKIDLEDQLCERFVKVPMMPAGIHLNPVNENELFFCSSRMDEEKYPDEEKVGLYLLNLNTRELDPVLLKLPILSPKPMETTFSPLDRPGINIIEMDETNSRTFCLCNDLDISSDGQRIYISEPVNSPRASMGSGAVIEAIGLAPIGKLWIFDRTKESIHLVLDNFTFVDGLLLMPSDSEEHSILFTETTKFRIMETFFQGPKSGTTEVRMEHLPGMPDGLDRDANGNIWIGLIKKRSSTINWLHRNPWIKPFFLRLPQSILPVSEDSGILALSSDGQQAVYYSMHDGSHISDISVVSPYKKELYFPVFNKESKGIYFATNPLFY
jgi:sugar lactone lactonase YvrE